jgi:hypothetical protein
MTKISFSRKSMIRPGILCQRKIMRKCVARPMCFLKKRMRRPETREPRQTHSLLHPERQLFRMKEALSGFIKKGGMAMKSQDPYDDEKTRRKIEAMVEAEERYLAALRRERLDSEANPLRTTGRRTFLAAAIAAAGVGGLPRIAGAAAPPGAVERPVPTDPTKVQGTPTNDDGGYGSRS